MSGEPFQAVHVNCQYSKRSPAETQIVQNGGFGAGVNGVKVESAVVEPGPFSEFIFHVSGPLPANVNDLTPSMIGVLEELEYVSGDVTTVATEAQLTPFLGSDVFLTCGKWRHHHHKGGQNISLMLDCWKVVTFVTNRNHLDAHNQLHSWSIPSRPLRSEPWAVRLHEKEWSQDDDDSFGPVGPLRNKRPHLRHRLLASQRAPRP